MNTGGINRSLTPVCAWSLVVLALAAGCKSPRSANIALRKENQALREQIERLQRQAAADRATIAALESERGTIERLPEDFLARLYTVAGLRLGRLTGIDGRSLRVQAVPIDESGQPLKAAGTFRIRAVDRSAPGRVLVETEFDLDRARQAWLGNAMQYAYLLSVPLTESPPAELELHVSFRDELTGREFTESRVIRSTG